MNPDKFFQNSDPQAHQTNPQSFPCLVREEGVDKEQDHKICFKNAFCFWSQEEKKRNSTGNGMGISV